MRCYQIILRRTDFNKTKFVITFEAENLFSESNYFFVNGSAHTEQKRENFIQFIHVNYNCLNFYSCLLNQKSTHQQYNAVFDLDKCFLVLCFRNSLMIFIEAVFSSNGWRRGIWINLGGLKLKWKVRRRFKRDPGGWIYVIWKSLWKKHFGKIDLILKRFELGYLLLKKDERG